MLLDESRTAEHRFAFGRGDIGLLAVLAVHDGRDFRKGGHKFPDKRISFGQLSVVRHQVDHELAGSFGVSNDQEAHIAAVLQNVINRQAVCGHERSDMIDDSAGDGGLQMTCVEVEDLVEPTAAVQPKGETARGSGMERILHLVAVAEQLSGRNNILHRNAFKTADARDRFDHLLLLVAKLLLIVEVLPGAAAALVEVTAERRNPAGGFRYDFEHGRLAIARPDAGDFGPYRLPRQSGIEEDHFAVQMRNRLAIERQVLDRQLDHLLAHTRLVSAGVHNASIASGGAAREAWSSVSPQQLERRESQHEQHHESDRQQIEVLVYEAAYAIAELLVEQTDESGNHEEAHGPADR